MRIYSIVIVLLPVLAVYKSPIPGVDLGTFTAIVLAPFIVKRIKIRNDRLFWMLIGYVLLSTVLNLLSAYRYSETTSIITRTFRFIYMMILFVGINRDENIDMSFYIKALRNVTLFVSIYAVIQLITFRVTGYKLINIFGSTKQGVVFSKLLGQYETTYRPPSIFLEPSSVTYYVVPFLCFCLFEPNYENYVGKRRGLIDAIIVSIGLVATTSGQGVAILGIIWLMWVFWRMRSKNIHKILTIIPIVIAGVIAVMSSSAVEYAIGRIYNTTGLSAFDARATGYVALSQLNNLQRIIGTGYGNYLETVYYASFADILFCLGYIGLIIIVSYYIKLYKYGNGFQRVLVISSLVLMGSGGIFTATYLCFYLPLLSYPFSVVYDNQSNFDSNY